MQNKNSGTKKRVMARMLAEELDKVRGGKRPLSCVITYDDKGNITGASNVSGDNDGPLE